LLNGVPFGAVRVFPRMYPVKIIFHGSIL
jgi:hypothetical protein